jgi:hypothetical protein
LCYQVPIFGCRWIDQSESAARHDWAPPMDSSSQCLLCMLLSRSGEVVPGQIVQHRRGGTDLWLATVHRVRDMRRRTCMSSRVWAVHLVLQAPQGHELDVADRITCCRYISLAPDSYNGMYIVPQRGRRGIFSGGSPFLRCYTDEGSSATAVRPGTLGQVQYTHTSLVRSMYMYASSVDSHIFGTPLSHYYHALPGGCIV